MRDSFGQTLMQRTDDLSAPDDRTIVFRLSKPFPLLPDALGKYAANMCAIMPERLATTDPFKQVTEVVGSGPFRFEPDERVQGSLYVYERFKDYLPCPDGLADFISGPKIVHFDRVEWHVNPDQGMVSSAVRSGEIDWQEAVINDLVPALRRDPSVRLQRNSPLGWSWVVRPNHLFPPFDNPAIRRVLIGAIDQAESLTGAMGADPAGWQTPGGFFPIGSPMASDVGMTALTGPRDPAKARSDLLAAGYRGEKIVVIVAGEGWAVKAITDVTVDTLKRIGMPVDYQVMDYTAMMPRRASKKPPDQGGWNLLVTAAPGVDWLTPATHYLLRGNGEQGTWGWPTSAKLEALRDRWFDAPDVGAQKAICAEMQTQAFDDVPFIPLGSAYISMAYRADLAGLLGGQPLFWNVRRQG